MRRIGGRGLWVLLATTLVATLAAVAPPAWIVPLAAQHALLAIPGVLLVRHVMGPAGGWLMPAAFGPLLGLGLANLALTGLWAAGGRGWWLIPVSAALVALLLAPARRLRGCWHGVDRHPSEATALAALLLLVPLIVALPFAHVGERLPDGQAYRAYFTADYVWRRAVVAELAKGDFLPVNPFFTGDALHYYWLPHMLSAIEYRTFNASTTLDAILLAGSVVNATFFIAFLYGAARWFGITPWPAAVGVAVAATCSSFEGLYALWTYWTHGVPLSAVRTLNIDAVSRWMLQAMPIDGLQRVLLYQPHHQIGYALGFLGLFAILRRTRDRSTAAFAIAGALLGLSTLSSSFAGLMLTVTAAVAEGVAVLVRRDWRRAVVHAITAAIPLGLAAAAVILLRYVDHGGQVIMLGLNRVAVRRFWPATALSFGPIILMAGAGALIAIRRRLVHLAGFAALAVTCVAFYFYVDVRDHQDVYVGWRVGHLTFMAAGIFIGLALQAMRPWSWPWRSAAVTAFALIVIGALPTTVIDVYNTQDTSNRGEAPGFRWTLILTPDDLQLFDWLKHNTAPDSVVQVDPLVRDSETWAYLPAFAERRMAVGLPISMVPLHKYQDGTNDVRRIFDAGALSAYDLAVHNHVDYLVVGPPERRAHPGVESRLDELPHLMPRVFTNSSITVYEITHH